MIEKEYHVTKNTNSCAANRCQQTPRFTLKIIGTDYQGRDEEVVLYFCSKHFYKKVRKLGWGK